MCGEKDAPIRAQFALMGSPPHVRGKDMIYKNCLIPSRITPACAGKSRQIHS